MGLLATGGDVPAQIAQNRGVNATTLAARLATETNTSQSTVKITATGQDADDTVALSKEVGDGLMQYVFAKNKAAYDQDVTDSHTKVDGLKAAISAIDATNPAPNSNDAAQREALSTQLRVAIDNELTIASQGEPKPILNPFQPPEAIPINGSQFAKFVKAGALNNNNTTVGPNDKSTTDNLDATLNPKSGIPIGSDPALADRRVPGPAAGSGRGVHLGAARQPGAVQGGRRGLLRAAGAVRGPAAHPGPAS